MWFGTRNGLNYFDGHEFKNYFMDPWDDNSLPNNVVNAITGDQKGTLWIGTEQGLCSYNKEFNSFTRYSLQELDKSDWIIASLKFDNQGNYRNPREISDIARDCLGQASLAAPRQPS